MEILTNSAGRVITDFFNSYLGERDWRKTLTYLTETVQWVGTGKNEIARGIQEARAALTDEMEKDPDPYDLKITQLEEYTLTHDCASVLSTLEVCRPSDEVNMSIRITAVCQRVDFSYKIASIHASAAYAEQEEGEYFPSRHSQLGPGEFEERISRRTFDLLSKSVSGGIMGGYLDEGFPLYYVNDRMLDYLGYTYEEFVTAIDGMVINCMHPEDRERVDKLVEEAFSKGLDYEVQYRMLKKDGSYIWVRDLGKKGLADDGREACLSVINDITREVEDNQRLLTEMQERKKQAQRYDILFRSVMCGIVQYHLGEQGAVVFKHANKEAIRIFGYEEKEFWEKKVWSLPEIVAEEDQDIVAQGISTMKGIGDRSDYEYRVVRRDGTYCWIIGNAEIIRDADGEILIQSVFLDIDTSKKAEIENQVLLEQVEAGNELLKMALEHTSTCEFYYYPTEQRCLMPERTRTYYNCKRIYENMPLSFAQDMVDPEWQKEYIAMYDKILKGEKTAQTVFRLRNTPMWCRMTMSAIGYRGKDRTGYVVGIIEDITKEKEMELALVEEHVKDRLTGLYTKEAGIQMIRQMLDRHQDGCLMLLDMDDFSRINAEEGNVFADVILQEVSRILKTETGKEDIQVRIGGDEFMLFIRDCNREQAPVLGNRISEKIKELSVSGKLEHRISASIGMCTTEVVDEYSGLYRCAESTLQYVKKHGKESAACFIDVSNEVGTVLTQVYQEQHQINVIENQGDYQQDLVTFALELLGKAKKLDDAITLLLARVGKQYGVDRVSLIEASPEYLSFRINYQWAGSKGDTQIEKMLYTSQDEFYKIADRFREEGISEAQLWNKQLMPSCLSAAIWNQGRFAGMMSLESWKTDYPFSQDQKIQLKELTKLITSFVMKAKADTVSRAKTDFLSRMSHEIRTPMNAISGMTTIAKTVLEDREQAMECLNKIESANSYLLDLINDILDMSRIESGKMELNSVAADLKAATERLQSMLGPQAAAKEISLDFSYQYPENRPLVVDMLRLNQVLINIIGNAVKFTAKGGKVNVEITPMKQGREEATIKFSVKDTGIGIHRDALGQIFNAFEQADKSTSSKYGGTGLGLSISYRLVKMMGGQLEVKSQVGVGSEFYFSLTLPYGQLSPIDVAPGKLPRMVPDFTGRRLLVAEDNELNREITAEILSMHGFLVEEAVDGKEAVEKFRDHPPSYYDAVLMDIRMPVMDGLEAARNIRTLGKSDSRSIPVIAMTANAFDEDSKKSLESGMNGHLTKPIVIEHLLDTLAAVIE